MMTKYLCAGILLSAFLIPSRIEYRPEYALVAAGAVAALIRYPARANLSTVGVELGVLSVMCALACVSLVVQILGTGSLIGRDLMILVRYAVYAMALLSGTLLGKGSTLGAGGGKVAWAIILLASFMSLVQYENYWGINEFLVPLYGDAEKHRALISEFSNRRVIGTLGNPNYWGFLLSCGFLVSLYHSLVLKRYVLLPVVFLTFSGIIASGSRTALLAGAAGATLCLFSKGGLLDLSNLQARSRAATFAVLLGLVAVSAWLISENSTALYENEGRFSVTNTRTLEYRLDYWKQFLSPLAKDPALGLIGRGPSKASEITMGDNMYVLLLRDFGVVSLGFFIFLQFYCWMRVRRLEGSLSRRRRAAAANCGLIIVSFAVFNIAADGWFMVRLTVPMLFLYGFVVARGEKNLASMPRIMRARVKSGTVLRSRA